MRDLGIVIIGRNEGSLLTNCIDSVTRVLGPRITDRIVYVDSGSSDGSPEIVERKGVQVVRLDPAWPFTAARGRNEGFEALRQRHPELRFVQFIDGDCELLQGWCEHSVEFLSTEHGVGVVCGRLRERYPERSVYNYLCDVEWNVPDGESAACGGIAMVRADVFTAAGGFRADLAGGEEPELCLRIREQGWKVWRLAIDMALHDAEMTQFGQWWRRMVRNGESTAQVYLMHRRSPFAIYERQTMRSLVWGGILPAAIVIGSAITPWSGALLLAYPAQIGRMAMQRGAHLKSSWTYAALLTVGKFAEFQGQLRLAWRFLIRHRRDDERLTKPYSANVIS